MWKDFDLFSCFLDQSKVTVTLCRILVVFRLLKIVAKVVKQVVAIVSVEISNSQK